MYFKYFYISIRKIYEVSYNKFPSFLTEQKNHIPKRLKNIYVYLLFN